MALWLRRFPTRSRWVALLAALLLLGTPALAAAPRVSEESEEDAPEVLREARAEPVRAERPCPHVRRTPHSWASSHAALTPRRSPDQPPHDPFAGRGVCLRC